MPSKDELLILAHLRHGRRSLTNIGKAVDMPLSTVFDRVNKARQYVKRHTVLMNFQKLGFSIGAQIFLRQKESRRKQLANFLNSSKSINSFAKIHNGYDYIVEGFFENMKSLNEFVELLKHNGAKEIAAFHIIEELKREHFLSNPDKIRRVL